MQQVLATDWLTGSDETPQAQTLRDYLVLHCGAQPRVLAVDTETSGLSPFTDALLFVQLKADHRPAVVIDCRSTPVAELYDGLSPYLSNPKILKVLHNAAFDMGFLKQQVGLNIVRVYDTMLAERLLTAGLFAPADLKTVAKKYLNVELVKETRNIFVEQGTALELTEDVLAYMAADVDVLAGIMEAQVARLKEFGMVAVAKLEFDVLPVLVEAHLHGVFIDQARWRKHITSLEVEEARITAAVVAEMQSFVELWRASEYAEAHAAYRKALGLYIVALGEWDDMLERATEAILVGPESRGDKRRSINAWKKEHPRPKKPLEPKCGDGPINLNSPDQVGGALLAMGVELPMKDSGKPETDRYALEDAAADWPVVALIRELRGYSKLIDSFGEAVLQRIGSDGRLHPEFNQLVSTGRMSSRAPNVQQVPANELGHEFRNCFIAPPGHQLITCDFSAMELRIAAHVTQEESMIAAFRNGVDPHSVTCAGMYHLTCPVEEIKERYPDKRKKAKIANFAVLYGAGPRTLARQMQCSLAEAKTTLDAYFESNQAVKRWLERVRQEALVPRFRNATGRADVQYGWVETPLGRKRFFVLPGDEPKDRSGKAWSEWRQGRGRVERQAGNHPIQGACADAMKLALVYFRDTSASFGYDATVVMVVHDEAVVEVRTEVAQQVANLLSESMIAAGEYLFPSVPIEVSCSVADCWSK